jgi:hypothetical protein
MGRLRRSRISATVDTGEIVTLINQWVIHYAGRSRHATTALRQDRF